MSRQFRPHLRDRIYWSRPVQGTIDVGVVVVSLSILAVIEPVRLVRRLFASTEDGTGEPSLYREQAAAAPEPRPGAQVNWGQTP